MKRLVYLLLFCSLFFYVSLGFSNPICQLTTDNLFVLMDASSSMQKTLPSGVAKWQVEKQALTSYLKFLPKAPSQVAIATFGSQPLVTKHPVSYLYSLGKWNQSKCLQTVLTANCGSGPTPLGEALRDIDLTLKAVKGRTNLLILSDGLENGFVSSLKEVQILKDHYGNQLCLSVIFIGNNPKGKALLQRLVKIGQCGFFIKPNEISPCLIKKITPVVKPILKPHKSSLDELIRKKCAFKKVTIYFDFNKYSIKPCYYKLLSKVAWCLSHKLYNRAIIAGYTDSIGSKSYNLRLSLKRAEAVKKYLTKHFQISPSKLVVIGYGKLHPVASNCKASGRARNRRVEIYLQ